MAAVDRAAEPPDVSRPWGGGRGLPDGRVGRGVEPRSGFHPRTLDGHHAREADPRIAEAVRQRHERRELPRQGPPGRAAGGHDELRAGIEPAARVVERVDRGLGVEVAVAGPVNPREQVRQERGHVVGVESGGIPAGDDEQVFGERELPLAEDRRRLRQQFGGPVARFPGQVPLAAHGQQQRMHARGVDRMHARNPRQHRRDHGAGQLVDEPAEERVFLGWPAHHRDRPDRPLAVPHVADPQHGEVVPAGIVAEVVAEGPFRLHGGRRHAALDHEVGVGVDGRSALAGDHRDPMPREHAGEREFGESLRQRHHRRDGQRRGPPHEDRHLQRLAPRERLGVVHADAAVELVVQPRLAVGLVVVACELHPVHAKIRMLRAGRGRILAVDSRQRDERPAVAWPRHHLREPREGNAAKQHRAGPHPLGQHRQRVDRRPPVPPRCPQRGSGIDLELDEPLHPVEGVGEDPLDPRLCAVEVTEDGEVGAAGLREQHRGAGGAEQPPLDLGDFEVRIDGMVDRHELPPGRRTHGRLAAQSLDAGLE